MDLVNELLKENGRDITETETGAEGGKKPEGGANPEAEGGKKPEEEGEGGGKKPEEGAEGGKKPEGEGEAGKKKPEGEGGKKPEEGEGGKKPEAGAEEDEDIDDERLKKYLKKKGIEVDKIEDLKKPKEAEPELTDEQKAEKKKKFREEAIKHAITNKESGIKSSDITAFELDAAKSPRDIVFPIMAEKWKQENPDLTAEELSDRFNEYYMQDRDADDWQRKDRENLMKLQANAYMQQKHAKVLGIEADYQEHIDTVEQAKTYNKTVEKVIASFPSENSFEIEVDLEDGKKKKETYSFKFSPESIASVREQLLNSDSFDRLGRGELSEEGLTAIVRSALIEKEFKTAVVTVARSHANKMVLEAKAGRKGAIPTHTGDGTQEVNLPPKRTIVDELLEENKR